MIQKFDSFAGVPIGHYYLWKTIQFSDFEVDAQEEILFHSESKEELVSYALTYDFPLEGSWAEYGISQRTDLTDNYLLSIVGKADENGHRPWIRPELVAEKNK